MTYGFDKIPLTTRQMVDRAPPEQSVAVLLRHAEREAIPAGSPGNEVPLTAAGMAAARALGRLMGSRLRTLHSSPVLRCMQTAEAMRAGAAADLAIVPDKHLGDPGVYVLDPHLAWVNWQRLGHDGVMRHLSSSVKALPGMARPDHAASTLAAHLRSIASEPGLHVFVTHDLLLKATASQLSALPTEDDKWPRYLEAAVF